MLPKTHIVLGAVFSLALFFIFPGTPLYGLLLIFLSSFLMDFDHYLAAARKTSSLSVKKAFNYYLRQGKSVLKEKARGIRAKGDFHVFHTIEFLLLIFILAIFWAPFIYIFIGMVFHSLLDIIYLASNDLLYRREFFFFNWIRKSIKNRNIK